MNTKTVKLLEENIGENICDFRLCKDFLKIIEVQPIKFFKDKLNFIGINKSAFWRAMSWEESEQTSCRVNGDDFKAHIQWGPYP